LYCYCSFHEETPSRFNKGLLRAAAGLSPSSPLSAAPSHVPIERLNHILINIGCTSDQLLTEKEMCDLVRDVQTIEHENNHRHNSTSSDVRAQLVPSDIFLRLI
jgi:hypothetical protein